jgi:hypothetical protein
VISGTLTRSLRDVPSYPAAVTNEPTAEIPAPPGPGRVPALGRSGGAVATGSAGAHGSVVGTEEPGTTVRPTPEQPTAVLGAVPAGARSPGVDRTAAPTVTDGTVGAPTGASVPPAPVWAGRRRRRWPVVVLSLLLVAALGLGGYLLATTRAYADRLEWTEDQARSIGADLTLTRSDLEGARSEIAGLQGQLTTAQERITALADEKAQIGDDREAQRQLLDYQARVSEAAGIVASALDQCVKGQDQLIAYLEDASSYDPADLSKYGSDVETLCRSASDANKALQSELAEK